MPREVWTFHESDISIYKYNSGSSAYDILVWEKCFTTSLRLSPQRENMQYREPGLAYERMRSVITHWEIEISEPYYYDVEQLNEYLSIGDKFRIVVDLTNSKYTGVPPLTNEQHSWIECRPISGPDISGQDNRAFDHSIRFHGIKE